MVMFGKIKALAKRTRKQTPGLSCTCVDLRRLALTLVGIKSERKSTHVFHRLAT